MTSSDFIDRLEQELRAASRRRVRLELARLPRVPAGVAVLAVTAAICVAVAVPFLAAHARSSAGGPARVGPAGRGGGSIVVGCSNTISGQLPAGWRGAASGTAVTGPIAWLYVTRDANHGSILRSHFVEALAVVEPGHDVTVTVPAPERRDLLLDYTSVAPRPVFSRDLGASSVTFKPCSGLAGQTQFDGGFILSRPQCAELDIQPSGSSSPILYAIPLGRTCGLPSGPPENVLKGNGIGQALFGEGPRSVVQKLDVLLGQPTRRHFAKGKAVCGIDGEIDWPGLEAVFHHRRFAGYSYGPKTPDGGVSGLATTRGVRVGETVREARRFYGSAFKVSPAQGGSYSVRTAPGVVDGFLSDVTNPKGRILTIEAGKVGCPAMTP